MEQTQVKIIGLTLNKSMGILQSCNLEFNPENKLISVKGEVGAGKTTLQKSLQLGTLGSDTLKDDKTLYGEIDEEIQLLDGEQKIFVGCKSNKKGGLDYVIFTKDENGKIIKDPVIDGVKATPATYLKSLQTALTWRMDELTSENPTVQKKILLELYKSELAKLGVIFDTKSELYSDSILGKIEKAEAERAEKDFIRRQVGGFANQLEPFNIFPIEHPETIPVRTDISKLEEQKSKLQYQIDNVAEVKAQKLAKIKNEADAIVLKCKEENAKIKAKNAEIQAEFDKKGEKFKQNLHTFNGISTDLRTLFDENCLKQEDFDRISKDVAQSFKNIDISVAPLLPELQFDEENKIITKPTDIDMPLLLELHNKKIEYAKLLNEPAGDTTELEKELETVVNNLIIAKANNKKCDMCDAFLNWHNANALVNKLRDEYANMLSSINTGVKGLEISVNKEDEESKLDIYLTYNGEFDVDYFNNPQKIQRKLSSYSGTQKPLICLLLQNYLLSKKPKAMRYLWIDNVPIDNKTKYLLLKMGEELGLTIIVNITGDFLKEELQSGDILIEGGEIFFN